MDEVKKAQDLIFNRSSIKYNLTIKITDVYKYYRQMDAMGASSSQEKSHINVVTILLVRKG